MNARRFKTPLLAAIVAAALLLSPQAEAQQSRGASGQTFDFDKGDILSEVIARPVGRWLWRGVSPGFNDVSLVFRYFGMLINVLYDTIAPYHPTAVGSYTRLGRRPAKETATNRNVNIAVMYAAYRSLLIMAPQEARNWRRLMSRVGLDPNDRSMDLDTPVGIGNTAAIKVMEARRHDGFNQFGDGGGRRYNLQPFADTTGYRPVNTAFELIDPSRWQPALVRTRAGTYRAQQFITPQKANTRPYASFNPRDFRLPPPVDSDPKNSGAYKAQVDAVLKASANLTDEQKMMAEFFDNKVRDFLAPPPVKARLNMMDFIMMDFLLTVAGFDAGIVTWQEKRRYDAVRPFSAIRHIYGDTPVTAWGGPGKGTVKLPASQWRSYLPTADHPEYPSASACVCAAQAQAMRRYTGSDSTEGWTVVRPAGSSSIEPGVTPAATVSFRIDTWTDFDRLCGQSRVWGGTHFQPSIDEARKACPVFGDLAWDYYKALVDGTAQPVTEVRQLAADPRQNDRSGR